MGEIWGREFNNMTGGDFEGMVFGRTTIKIPAGREKDFEDKYLSGKNESNKNQGKDGPQGLYLNFSDSLQQIRDFTSQNPENPTADFANDVRIELLDQLEISDEDSPTLRFYTALLRSPKQHTSADVYHGVDSWFEWQPEGFEQPIIVLLDATLNPNKISRDDKLLISKVPDIRDAITKAEKERIEAIYLEQVNYYANEILQELLYKKRTIERRSKKS